MSSVAEATTIGARVRLRPNAAPAETSGLQQLSFWMQLLVLAVFLFSTEAWLAA